MHQMVVNGPQTARLIWMSSFPQALCNLSVCACVFTVVVYVLNVCTLLCVFHTLIIIIFLFFMLSFYLCTVATVCLLACQHNSYIFLYLRMFVHAQANACLPDSLCTCSPAYLTSPPHPPYPLCPALAHATLIESCDNTPYHIKQAEKGAWRENSILPSTPHSLILLFHPSPC